MYKNNYLQIPPHNQLLFQSPGDLPLGPFGHVGRITQANIRVF